MHMHLVMFQILDRDSFTKDPNGVIIPGGDPQPPLAEEAGWKDTVMVGPNQIVRVITRFEAYKGKYPYHCHILEHEEHEMMRQFQTVSCGDGEPDPTETCDDGGKQSFDGCSMRCRTEEFINLSGVGLGGGLVQATISGEVVSVGTTAGQSAAGVAQSLAAEINADATLRSLDVMATPIGPQVVVESGDVTNLQITDAGFAARLDLAVQPTRLWWSTVNAPNGYDVARGSLSQGWATRWDFSNPSVTQICLADNEGATSSQIIESPAPGDGVWYVVRVQGGTYDSGDASQNGSRDAGINASGNGCP
jgi:cysteine-rich repeat protein